MYSAMRLKQTPKPLHYVTLRIRPSISMKIEIF